MKKAAINFQLIRAGGISPATPSSRTFQIFKEARQEERSCLQLASAGCKAKSSLFFIMSGQKLEQAKHEAALAAEDVKEAAILKAQELKQAGQHAAHDALASAESVVDDASQKAHEVKDAAGRKWEETKEAGKDAAQTAIDKSRHAADATNAKVHEELDKAEAAVEDERSFVQQAKDGAVAAASAVGTQLAHAGEVVKDLAVAGYDKVAHALDGTTGGDHPKAN